MASEVNGGIPCEESEKKEVENAQKDGEGGGLEAVESQVYTASPLSLGKKEKNTVPTLPLTLDWAYGYNSALPVFSLLDQDELAILYVSAHVAVIYDHTSNSQHLLHGVKGHHSPISCLCVSEDRRWIVTGDRGQENLVIVWDSYTGIPVRTFFRCHAEGGVAALALSKDAKYLATVGAGVPQRVCIWNWTNENDFPECSVDVSREHSNQHHILFHPNDKSLLISNSQTHVLFYTWDKGGMKYSAPEISDRTFRTSVGAMTQSVFGAGGIWAFTATLTGNVALWDASDGSAVGRPHLGVKAAKLLPLQPNGITVLTLCDCYLVTGDTEGVVKFYNQDLKLMNLYELNSSGGIVSISFSKEPPPAGWEEYQQDCSISAKPFIVRNFVLSSSRSTVVHVRPQGTVVRTLLQAHVASLQALSCHPTQTLVAMGGHDAVLKVWDYRRKEVFNSIAYPEDKHIHCLVYDPQGLYLAVGFVSGEVQVLNPHTLQKEREEQSLHHSRDCITHLTFSHDSSYLASADGGHAVTVFRRCKDNGEPEWSYLGKYRSHYKPIQELLFGLEPDSTRPRLLSLGADRRLVEYDLQNSVQDELLILESVRVEQSAVPTCATWYPALGSERFLLTANDHYKLKLYNATTNMCRKTVLGPSYGSPLKKMQVLPPSDHGSPGSRYVAYATQDKVGVQIVPLDGNPFKTLALLCHSSGVSAMCCSYDGSFVFTAGGDDRVSFQWELSLPAYEAAAALGGTGLQPFYTLLDGGREGELFRDIKDFFYYCQLHNQSIDSMETRRASTHMPLAEVPFVMRAIGFYPTEQELEDMHNEVKFSRYAETGQYVSRIDLDEFVKLYLNHRPAFGLFRTELRRAFGLLGDRDDQLGISRDQLLALLQDRGEHMTEEEVAECFITLLGFGEEGGRCETGTFECKDADSLIKGHLPSTISVDAFASDVLGFDPQEPPEQDDSCPEDHVEKLSGDATT